MKCPFCQSKDTHVTDTRWSEGKWIQRRRYECRECRNRFTTQEGYNTKTRKQMLIQSNERRNHAKGKETALLNETKM